MTPWIVWVLCGVVLAIVVFCIFDQIRQEAAREEEAEKRRTS